ncbi:MAG: hypothetical protein JJE45_00310 [Prolixibacteraceae bacterium]|nr:hypothetical protein [Prolixibacteraceae bacterium]
MKIIKQTKYLYFSDESKGYNKKTKTIAVINKSSGYLLAYIEWYGAWRQYCFTPNLEFDTVWNNTCLKDVLEVIDMLMKERQIDKPKGE